VKPSPPERDEYYVQVGSMFDNPFGVPKEEIMQMLANLELETAAQVIFGKYVESSGLVFTAKLVQMLFDRKGFHYDGTPFSPITGDLWVDKTTVEQAKQMSYESKKLLFASGVDLARLNDYTVIFTLDLRSRPARVVHYRRLNRVPWESIYREVGRTASLFGPNILADATGMAGDVILEALEDRHYCPIHGYTFLKEHGSCMRDGVHIGGCKESLFIPLSCVDGYQFTRQSKQALVEHLRNVLGVGYKPRSEESFGWLRCPPIPQLEEELGFYAWDDKHLDTDTVMALGLAAWLGLELTPGESYEGSPYGL
jgi:hypothetical protein